MSEAVSAEVAPATQQKPAGNEAPTPSDRIAELRVTAHLMTLETGLYCVFPTPGSPDPDPRTGLPGVRVTPAPGLAGRPEAVSVSTFREDGWLNGTAALVHVADGTAQILVSIYQNPTARAPMRRRGYRFCASTRSRTALPAKRKPLPPARPRRPPAPRRPPQPRRLNPR